MAIDKPEPGAPDKLILIYATFPSHDAAETAAAALVDARLVACANIIPGVVSIYEWQGQRQRDAEVAMVLKTRAVRLEAVTDSIKARHPYDTPAIVAVELVGGSADYLAWVLNQT